MTGPSQPPIVVMGAGPWAGAYLLTLTLSAACAVRFGRFAQGKPLPLAPGVYVYIGSAQGAAQRMPLLRRIHRHLIRTAPRPPQRIVADWQAFLTQQKLCLPAPSPKRLRWHIDYLLEEPACEVVQVTLIPSSHAIEQRLTEVLETLPGMQPAAPGLGASDHPGHTHLLQWQGTQTAWDNWQHALPSTVTSWQTLA